MRVDLNVPFAEKDDAKKLGARWDAVRRVWYVSNLENLEPFLRWVAPHLRRPAVTKSHKTERTDGLNKQQAAHIRELLHGL